MPCICILLRSKKRSWSDWAVKNLPLKNFKKIEMRIWEYENIRLFFFIDLFFNYHISIIEKYRIVNYLLWYVSTLYCIYTTKIMILHFFFHFWKIIILNWVHCKWFFLLTYWQFHLLKKQKDNTFTFFSCFLKVQQTAKILISYTTILKKKKKMSTNLQREITKIPSDHTYVN